MIRKKLSVIIDFDDVLASCNEHACTMHQEATGEVLDYNSITDWGELGLPVDARMAYFQTKEFYQTQPAYFGAAEFLRELMRKVDVFICTAVYPEYMGDRIEHIQKLFPFFPMENILMGNRKDIVHADIMLDDGIHNLMHGNVSYPVLFRRPWNKSFSGIASVRTYQEFLALVDTIRGEIIPITFVPKVVCILGPSGSGKNEAAQKICSWGNCERVGTFTTSKVHGNGYLHLDGSELEHEEHFFESSYYCGSFYASSLDTVKNTLDRGNHAVMVLDITGCMAMRSAFPGRVIICYKARDRKECIRNTISKKGLRIDQITDRLYGMEYEEKNELIADVTITDDDYSKLRALL